MKFALITYGNEESYGLLFVGGELLLHNQTIKYFDGEVDDIEDAICAWAPDFLMYSPMTAFYHRAVYSAKILKRVLPLVTSVFGGHHAMSVPEITELDAVDVVVLGPVRGSIERILAGEVGVIKTPLTNPADLARPAREQCYKDIPRLAHRYRKFMLSIIGCPWNCSYCSSASGHMRELFGVEAHKRYYLTRRPIDAVIAEAKEILLYPTKEIEWVDDDIFAGVEAEEYIPRLARAWKDEIGLPMYVSATSTSVLKASDNMLRSMKDIVNVVGIGVQASRKESLKLFNRQWDNETKMKAAYDRLKSFGFNVNLQCIVGLPVEDPVEEALDTIKMLQRIGAGSIVSCYPLQIYPTTQLEKYCIGSDIKINRQCNGDTNTGVTGIAFTVEVEKVIKNICKLATLFVKFNIDEKWMRALLKVNYDDETSKHLSVARYQDCVEDRLHDDNVFETIIKETNLRY